MNLGWAPQALVDRYGRKIDYLRISLTDQCNFRCLYCVPPEGLAESSREKLSADEIERLARVAVDLGFRKFRFTGGEPLLRLDLEEIISRVARLRGKPKLLMTTNGFALKKRIAGLKKAGLQGVNVSLDSLDRKRFYEVTRCDRFDDVWEGIFETLQQGLSLKINVVVVDGLQDEEILRFADLATEYPVDIRFLEVMPLCGTGYDAVKHVPTRKVKEVISSRYPLEPLAAPADQPARLFALRKDGKVRGRIGFIESLSDPFCHACSRLRILADGTIRPCLFSDLSFDLKPALRSGNDDQLREVFFQAVFEKPKGHDWRANSPRKPESYPLIHNTGG